MLDQKKMGIHKGKDLKETPNAGYLYFDLCESHNPPCIIGMCELSFWRSLMNYLEGIQKGKQLHWAGSFGPFLLLYVGVGLY